jgi:hypothetical protein
LPHGGGNEQTNIEQGMSKEEGRGLSEEIATKNAKNLRAAFGRNQTHSTFTVPYSQSTITMLLRHTSINCE